MNIHQMVTQAAEMMHKMLPEKGLPQNTSIMLICPDKDVTLQLESDVPIEPLRAILYAQCVLENATSYLASYLCDVGVTVIDGQTHMVKAEGYQGGAQMVKCVIIHGECKKECSAHTAMIQFQLDGDKVTSSKIILDADTTAECIGDKVHNPLAGVLLNDMDHPVH